MENLFNPWNIPSLRSGRFPSPIPIDAPLQQVAIIDVAAVCRVSRAYGSSAPSSRWGGQRVKSVSWRSS
jgi:hypothetical protein